MNPSGTLHVMPRFVISLSFCFLVATIASECSGQDALAVQLNKLRSAQPASYDEIIGSVLKTKPTTRQITDAIRADAKLELDEKRKEKLVAGWSAWEATDVQGVTRPYQLFLPKSVVEGGSAKALIVHMHGAVGRAEFGTGVGEPMAIGYAGLLWPKVAEKEKFVIVCPIGRTECSWWTDNGVAHVNAVIRDVRRSIDFPEESMFGAGFSDGGSGCYYRAMAAPDPFAGFIALNGHPRVGATDSGKQLYLENMAMTSTIAAMTQQDSLYPSKYVMPHILTAIEEGGDILALSYPRMNHQPGYFRDQTPAILSFISKTKRETRSRIKWYASSPEVGKFQWLELLEFASPENAVDVRDVNVMTFPPTRIQLGVQFAGFSDIGSVVEGSPAARAGVKAGDVMLKFDGEKVSNTDDLRGLLGSKNIGDEFTCLVKRGSSEMNLSGKFPEFVPRPVYARDNPTGWIDCRFDIEADTPSLDVSSQNVTKIRVWLPSKLASLKNVSATVNGSRLSLPVKRQSPKSMLKSFADSAFDLMNREAFLDIEIQ